MCSSFTSFTSHRAFHKPSSRKSLQVVCARKVSKARHIVSSKTLIARPGHEEQVEKLVADVTMFSMQQAKDRQAGIHVFEAVKDQFEPNVFHTWERYESNAHMARHNTSNEYKTFMEQVNSHLDKPVAMALYEWREGALGPACTSEGPKGEGGLDDATGATGAAGGASLKQTSTAFTLAGTDHEARHVELPPGHDGNANTEVAGNAGHLGPIKIPAHVQRVLSQTMEAAQKQVKGLGNPGQKLEGAVQGFGNAVSNVLSFVKRDRKTDSSDASVDEKKEEASSRK